MYFVYILQSLKYTSQFYVGFSEDLGSRLQHHNQGLSTHTKKFKPWKVKFYCGFEDKDKALAFEKYLKNASGKAFLYKRFI